MRVSTKRYSNLFSKTHSHYGDHAYYSLGTINISEYGECKVICDSLEGTDHPHFHIIDKDDNTLCCIDMYKPTYYRGHTKDKHIRLSQEECKELQDIMNTPAMRNTSTTWYSGICEWDEQDNDITNWKDDPKLQPDYTKLKTRKEN